MFLFGAALIFVVTVQFRDAERLMFHFQGDPRQWRFAKVQLPKQYVRHLNSIRDGTVYVLGPLVIYRMNPLAESLKPVDSHTRH